MYTEEFDELSEAAENKPRTYVSTGSQDLLKIQRENERLKKSLEKEQFFNRLLDQELKDLKASKSSEEVIAQQNNRRQVVSRGAFNTVLVVCLALVAFVAYTLLYNKQYNLFSPGDNNANLESKFNPAAASVAADSVPEIIADNKADDKKAIQQSTREIKPAVQETKPLPQEKPVAEEKPVTQVNNLPVEKKQVTEKNPVAEKPAANNSAINNTAATTADNTAANNTANKRTGRHIEQPEDRIDHNPPADGSPTPPVTASRNPLLNAPAPNNTAANSTTANNAKNNPIQQNVAPSTTQNQQAQQQPAATAEKPVIGKYLVSSKANFYSAPDENTLRSYFISPGSDKVVNALEDKNGFIYVEFKNDVGYTTKGWLSKADLTKQ